MVKQITPEDLAASGTEHGHQAALIQWTNLLPTVERFPLFRWLYAIPNGGERKKSVAGEMRAEGVKSGVPDLHWPVSRGGFLGLYLELKRPVERGRSVPVVSSAQKEWIRFLQEQGYGACVCYGWLQARATLIAYHDQSDSRPKNTMPQSASNTTALTQSVDRGSK